MKKTCILIRFDDICPTMNWEQWAKACALLDAYGKKPLIGVIPDCKDPDLQINEAKENFWEYVRELQAQGYKIAMHGHQHIFISQHKGMVNNRVGSEFAGLSYEKQLEKILAGQKILKEHGIETDVFFAPAHSYDLNTLRALKKAGKPCLACGTCTFVCPTCQCYDIKDYDTGHGVKRYRCWDSCMYSDFTMMAHGNNRTSQLQRFRQRFMHKLVYYPANNNGMYSCVGCGRCVEKCPASLNIVKVIKAFEKQGGDK